ncbi:hypothetical protein, partial [Nocardia carnea]|uniref:hypothetical protein n=1 Tax=Nocardia carnea TaxID=37328 RepID=UPI002455EC39
MRDDNPSEYDAWADRRNPNFQHVRNAWGLDASPNDWARNENYRDYADFLDRGQLRDTGPGSGTPGSGTPGSGTPGSGTPGSGTPGSGTPGSG